MKLKSLFKIANRYKFATGPLAVHPEAFRNSKSKGKIPLQPSDIQQAREALQTYLTNQVEEESRDMALNRYQFILLEVIEGWYAGDIYYEFSIVPKAAATSTTEDNRTIYKSPQETLEAISQKPGYAYRGMAFEEFEEAMRRGYVQSRGGYNLGEEQKNLTFFSPEADTAQYYASGFAPWKYKPTHNKPGVVIAIDEDQMLSSEDHSGIPGGELAAEGKLPTYMIDYIYYIIPTEIRWGKLKLSDSRGQVSVNFAMQPSLLGFSILQKK